VAEVGNCKAVVDDCTPLIADARSKLSVANFTPTMFERFGRGQTTIGAGL